MHLIQIQLPLTEEKAASASTFGQLREELTAMFGGLTFYRNAPAQGLWQDAGDVQEDAVVIAEVMAEEVDCQCWRSYR